MSCARTLGVVPARAVRVALREVSASCVAALSAVTVLARVPVRSVGVATVMVKDVVDPACTWGPGLGTNTKAGPGPKARPRSRR
ncbi:hypothetical protein EDF55_2034 [Curtobacterium sp. ZW137]|nr:hypothetical protein EDF55_2034 [Curtobacterium sp. ZW137]